MNFRDDSDPVVAERRHAADPTCLARRRADDLSPSVADALAILTAAIHEQARLAHERDQAAAARAEQTQARASGLAKTCLQQRLARKKQPAHAKLQLVKKRSA